ncbi:hypothetical protein ACYSNR_07635 [Enterococcus sp. LJL128]
MKFKDLCKVLGEYTVVRVRNSDGCLMAEVVAAELSNFPFGEYALFWLIEGRERTFDDTSKVTDLSKQQREELWGDIREMESFHKLSTGNIEIRELDEEEKRVLTEAIGLLDTAEKDVFMSIYGEQNTEELTAEYLDMTKSAVKYYKKRIQTKIDEYNNVGYQLSFC